MRLTDATWIFLDTETTGLKAKESQIIELGWCVVNNMQVGDSQDFLINPGRPIPPKITQITHISDTDVADKPGFEEIAPIFLEAMNGSAFVAAYNKDFDREMLNTEFARIGMKLPEREWLDPLTWARGFIDFTENHKLATIASQFKVSLENAHRADADARAAAEILVKFFQWGVEEANFPDDVDAIKEMEHSIFRNVRAKQNIMSPLKKQVKDPETGEMKRKVVMTGDPGRYAQNVSDAYYRDRLMKLNNAGKWRK